MGPYEQLEGLLSKNPWLPERAPQSQAELSGFISKVGIVAAEPSGTGSANHVGRQHVVSQCIQRNFTEDPTRPGSNLLAVNLDLLQKPTYRPGEYSTRSTGYFLDFVGYDSAGSEQLWKVVEDCIPLSVPALGLGLPKESDQLIVRSAIALHWARRLTTKRLTEQSVREAYEQVPAAVKHAFALSGGLHTTASEIDGVRAATAKTLMDLDDNGSLFRYSVERIFRRAVSACRLGRIFILSAPDNAEFLIGDNPVIVHDMDWNHAPDAPLLELYSMAMPLTPQFMVKIERDGHGTGAVTQSLTQDEVDSWNRLQVAQAKQFVMHRPGANLLDDVRSWVTEIVAK